MRTLLRAFVLAGVFGVSVAAVASAQDIPTNVTLSCPGGKIWIESCNIRDTSDNSTCLVGHPDTIMPNGLMKYTNETRGNLKKLLPQCQKAAPAQASTKQANPPQSAAANKPGPSAPPQSTPSYRPPAKTASSAPPAAPSPAVVPGTLPTAGPASAAAPPAATGVNAPSSSPASFTPGTPLTMTSVSIKNSPGVPDLGGHSILGGILRGSLTAVEPNLFLCVTPTGGRKTCTDVCPPGHDCTQPLGEGIRINGANRSVRVEVMDNDKQGHITSLGVADITDTTMYTESQPCTQNFPDSTSPDPAHGTDSTLYFTLGSNGSAAPKGNTPDCHGPYKSINAAVMLDSFGRQALNVTAPGATEYGFVVVRDPKYLGQQPGNGGCYVSPPVPGGAGSSAVHPVIATKDYELSQHQAKCGANNLEFKWAATVHTHVSAWKAGTPFNSDFTPDDFSQGIQLKMDHPNTFEEIVMIYVGDRNLRMFTPKVSDCPEGAPRRPSPDCEFACCPFGGTVAIIRTVPILSSLWHAWSAGDRTIIIGHYP
jgi:hypothetical protein